MTEVPASTADYAALARARLPEDVWHYLNGGAGDEVTLAANVSAFRRLAVRPRVLVDVRRRDATTRVLGTALAAPIGVAPMAYHRLAHPDGEAATARAAAAEGLLMIASTFASRPIEEVAAAAPGRVWFQIYCFRDHGLTDELIKRAEEAGCRALVLTADTPLMGWRDRDIRHRFLLPDGVEAANLRGLAGPGDDLAAVTRDLLDPGVTWTAVERIRGVTDLPVVLKGVLTAEDAALAVECGVSGVIVSNHGGRQLDGAIAALDALAEVAGAICHLSERVEVYLDGGVRRGIDVLKALALGARAVFVGRPVLWGLAAAGEEGARGVLRLLKAELDVAMALSGRPAVAELGRDAVCPAGGCS
ncbi:alpha-hydroxy acid oxidase [Nonomuraea sp. NPDC049309]|uniref:alpha-hydroxy acid oxidase n=1 Tax=Nonomuraea sp. NPDC049309 TaxID=3364350 RepID=UPI0037137CC1